MMCTSCGNNTLIRKGNMQCDSVTKVLYQCRLCRDVIFIEEKQVK